MTTVEHPILFSATMVRAILANEKTQTRRVVKPQPIFEGQRSYGESWKWAKGDDGFSGVTTEQLVGPYGLCFTERLTYGNIGDRLWVRETWRMPVAFDKKSPKQVADKALDAGYRRPWAPIKFEADGRMDNPHLLKDFGGAWGKKRVSIHMPRWASRITLEITGVRVERLQAISEEDAKAEGPTRNGHLVGFPVQQWEPTQSCRDAFQQLWGSINGQDSWAANPWVWVVSFKRVLDSAAEAAA